MKRIASFTFCVMALLLPFIVFAEGHGPVKIDHLSGPFGTGTYVLGSALEDISNKHHPWLRITNSESPGAAYLIKKLTIERELRKTMFIANSAITVSFGEKGLPPFDKKYDVNLKLLGTYFIAPIWLATLDPKIKSIEDLKGKKIGLGRKPQAGWTFIPEAILRDGWEIRDQVDVQYLGTKPAANALLDGLVDAAVIGGYLNPTTMDIKLSPQTIELIATGKKLYHIPWGKKQLLKAIEKGTVMTPTTIPAGAFEGLDKDLPIFAIAISWYAAPEFRNEWAYELVKLIVKNTDKLGEYHNIGKLITPQSLIYGASEKDIHPGALKAYKELKILK